MRNKTKKEIDRSFQDKEIRRNMMDPTRCIDLVNKSL